MFHPKGGIIRKAMEDYSRQRHVDAGYEFVYTPHITKGHLYEVSGHLDWYKEGMFPAMHIDAELNEDGTVRKPGQDYYLKPMNCPMHNLIFRSRGRSYRELPLRLFEFGSVYRYEKSGVVHGLTRVRGMTQDDAHIYCTREQMKDELTTTLNFVLGLLKDYGLDDFYLELSTKNEDKFVGDDATWEEATRTLAEVAEASGLELIPDPGGAAFYGPKISVQAKDALGRTWQMSTIQLDFNLPERFELEFQAADGTRQRPVMIHRALFGSVERFMGVLTEHYAGAFPAWLAPVQVVGIPVAEAFNDYMFDVVGQLKAAGIRAEVDIVLGPLPEEDPHRQQGQDPVRPDRRRRGRRGRSRVVPLPRRQPGQRRAGGRGRPEDCRSRPQPDQLAEAEGQNDVQETTGAGGDYPGDGDVTDDFGLAGVPDAFQRLWTPHRMAYIKGGQHQFKNQDDCPFCVAPARSDEDSLIVHRGSTCYVVLNLFPYNPGHLLICPYRHVPDYTDLTVEETADFADLTQTAMRVLRKVSNPGGFNLGHEPGRGGRGRNCRPPAPARCSALGRGRELLPHHRPDESHHADPGRGPPAGRRGLARGRTCLIGTPGGFSPRCSRLLRAGF